MSILRRQVAVAIIALILGPLVATCALAQTGSGAGKTGLGKHPGRVHYVAVGGSNRGAGTAEEPWASLQHAVDSALPGDSILIHEGTYAGARIEGSGTREAPITLRACTGESVVIDRPGPNNRHNSDLELETWEGDGRVSYWVIEGLEVTSAPAWGIDVRGSEKAHSHHITIRGNRVHDNGLSDGKSGIFAAFTDDVLIEGNASYHNGEHGIYVNNSSDRFVIRGNRVYDNIDCGIHLNGDIESGGDGVMTGGIVADNIIYDNGRGGGAGINMDGVSDSVVANNLLYDNHASGIALFQGNGAVCSQDNRIWNNTILMPSDGRWAIIIASPECSDNQICNNILYSAHSYHGSINIASRHIEGLECDYNIVVNRFTTDDGDSILTLADWHSLGYGTHSLMASPEEIFVDTSKDDFHLRPGSLAIDRGYDAPQVSTDLDGRPRPIGIGPDIGAYEYQAASSEPAHASPKTHASSDPAFGHIYYTLADDMRLYRLDLNNPGAPEDLTTALDKLAGGSDEWANVSPDGDWVLLSTERSFHPDCVGWACLVLLRSDLSSWEVLHTPKGVIHTEGFSAVASGGDLVVYAGTGGPHTIDLWAVARRDVGWSSPTLLTRDSPYDVNNQPAISADGSRVVFDCDPNLQDGQQGTAICQVRTDGTGFRTVISPTNGPGGTDANALHHPDYAPDGSIIFEADWHGEQIWRLPVGASVAERVSDQFNNDNSPCVLPDGRIASLWLDRPGSASGHELKVMLADGSGYFMALTDVDLFDIGIGCGR